MDTLSLLRPAVAACAILAAIPAHAESPLQTDDAGTLAVGGKKIELTLDRDDELRGGGVSFGFAPIANVEVGLGLARHTGEADWFDIKANNATASIKWVPLQNETGMSYGLRADIGRTRITSDDFSDRITSRESALTALATWRAQTGQAIHVNLGRARAKAEGQSETVTTWGIGGELPLAAKLAFTLETFGQSHSGPDKAVGLRYTLRDGLKLSAAFGNGNDRNFFQAGAAWEF